MQVPSSQHLRRHGAGEPFPVVLTQQAVLEDLGGMDDSFQRRHAFADPIEQVHHVLVTGDIPPEQTDRDTVLAPSLDRVLSLRLWITRINAGARENGISYNEFRHGLNQAESGVDRKMLADLAVREPEVFAQMAARAKDALEAR